MLRDDELAAYREGVQTGVMKSATPNVVGQLILEIDRLREHINTICVETAAGMIAIPAKRLAALEELACIINEAAGRGRCAWPVPIDYAKQLARTALTEERPTCARGAGGYLNHDTKPT